MNVFVMDVGKGSVFICRSFIKAEAQCQAAKAKNKFHVNTHPTPREGVFLSRSH